MKTIPELSILFAIVLIGQLIGRIHLGNVSFGVSAVFFVGLLAGHLGAEVSDAYQTCGLAFYIAALGLSAGPTFGGYIRTNGLQSLAVCFTTAGIGVILCVILVRVLHLSTLLAVGIMTGSFTTSPEKASALQPRQKERFPS